MSNDQQEPLDEQLAEYHSMMDDIPGEPEGDGDYTVYPPLHGESGQEGPSQTRDKT